jgi:hypothetical protein
MHRNLTLTAVMVAVLLTGCGGDDKNEKYRDALNTTITENFGAAQIEAAASAAESSPESARSVLPQVADDLEELAAELEAIKAPNAKAKAQVSELATILRQYAGIVVASAANSNYSTFPLVTELAIKHVKTSLRSINGESEENLSDALPSYLAIVETIGKTAAIEEKAMHRNLRNSTAH